MTCKITFTDKALEGVTLSILVLTLAQSVHNPFSATLITLGNLRLRGRITFCNNKKKRCTARFTPERAPQSTMWITQDRKCLRFYLGLPLTTYTHWDSNPEHKDFKSSVSANWTMRAYPEQFGAQTPIIPRKRTRA